jgi:large subunit ribosomal protein L6
MSRVGKNPIQIPSGVTVAVKGNKIEVSGKLGTDSCPMSELVVIKTEQGVTTVSPVNETKEARMIWGTTQRQIQNMVKGVSEGCTVNLELVGVGYRASVQGDKLCVQLGFSHDVFYTLPKGYSAKCEKPTSIAITGPSKQVVGQIAAEIRKYRKPEPYKGKGVIREGEFVVRKEGKKK